MKISLLEKNLMLSNQQKIVDDLEKLKIYAVKYKACNRNIVLYDLKKAKEKLEELKRL